MHIAVFTAFAAGRKEPLTGVPRGGRHDPRPADDQ
jgi:hypothetical protein